jgi:formyltetrahydrofolate-dependent phosphoribosylglycinamide formyltransferase
MVGPRGRGSNMRALIEACLDGTVPAHVGVVIAPASNTNAETTAVSLGVRTQVVPPGDGYGERLLAALDSSDWLCLAGFLRILPKDVLDRFPNRVLNIHPSLLPKFGGKGMYGHHVHEAVLAAGETQSGCTVHFVNERYDDGAIVLRKVCPVLPDDSPDTLAARILVLEHQAYPEALAQVIRDRSH